MAGSAATSEVLRPAKRNVQNPNAMNQHTLIRRLRQVKHPVFVRRLTSFLCRPPESILLASPGSEYGICGFEFMPEGDTFDG